MRIGTDGGIIHIMSGEKALCGREPSPNWYFREWPDDAYIADRLCLHCSRKRYAANNPHPEGKENNATHGKRV